MVYLSYITVYLILPYICLILPYITVQYRTTLILGMRADLLLAPDVKKV